VRQSGISGNYIFSVGRANPLKNFTRIIDAFALLKDKYPHKLVLAGIVGDHSHLEESIVRNGMKDRVVILGHISSNLVLHLYSGCDVFVFPSLYEGHSLSLLEAMACGCAIVTSNFGSMLETVGDSAICVNSYDAGSIAEGLDRLLSDPDLRKKLGAAARERVKRWTPEACAEGTLKVLEEAWRQKSV
jgi:glycosyltransferase involved in cell wall biosynthesis